MHRFKVAAAAALLACSCLAAGCERGEPAKRAEGKLKVLYGSEESFRYMYGDYFTAKFPEVEPEIVPTQDLYGAGVPAEQELVKLVKEQQPDLLILNAFEYPWLAAAGQLYELGPLAAKDKFDLKELTKASLDYLTGRGQGRLYGLAPTFHSSALFYNKKLFDERGIDYPKDGMTWDDMLLLAARFAPGGADGERIYGFHMPYMSRPQAYASYVASEFGISFLDPNGRRITMDTESWRTVYRMTTAAYRAGTLKLPSVADAKTRYEKEDIENMDLFSQGRAAMTIARQDQIDAVKQRGRPFEYGIAAAPVAEKGSAGSSQYDVYPIFAISANSPRVDAAWEVVKYFNGEEAAKVRSKTTNDLPTRKSFLKERDGHSLEPFYQVTYRDRTYFPLGPPPQTFLQQFDELLDKQTVRMINGEISVEEGLRFVQEEGQRKLDEAWLAAPQQQ